MVAIHWCPHCWCAPVLPSVPGPFRGIPIPCPPGRKLGAALLRYPCISTSLGCGYRAWCYHFWVPRVVASVPCSEGLQQGNVGLDLRKNFTKGSAWAAPCQPGGVVSDLSLKQELIGLTDKPDRSPLDRKMEGSCILGLYACGYLYTCVSQSRVHICGAVTV